MLGIVVIAACTVAACYAVPIPTQQHAHAHAHDHIHGCTHDHKHGHTQQQASNTPGWSPPAQQERLMAACIVLAKEAVAAGGSPYGALIADPRDGSIV